MKNEILAWLLGSLIAIGVIGIIANFVVEVVIPLAIYVWAAITAALD